jgi:methylated-DNA-[protein]-cysteine S-methyltransferase
MRDGVEPRREHVLAHLRRCATCQELYREYEGVVYCLSCLPVVEPPSGLVPKILDHIKSTVRRHHAGPDGVAGYHSPLGDLYVAFRPSGITYVGIDLGEGFEAVRRHVERRLHRPVREAPLPDFVRARLDRYFATWSTGPEGIELSTLTDFEQAAMHKAMEIPPGEVRSYSWIAREIGHPMAARAVGQVMARNPVALLVPCHRVVDANGDLHNYGYGLEVKARILAMEGYRVPVANASLRNTSAAPSEVETSEGNRRTKGGGHR